MIFKNDKHQRKFMQLIMEDGTHPKDVERKTLFYILFNDIKRYNKYKENNLNCKLVTEDREKVLNLIK